MKILGQKSLGVNPESGNDMVLQIVGYSVNALTERITVQFRICDVSKNGEVFYPLSQGQFYRENLPGNPMFNNLFDSDYGKATMAMFGPDLEAIKNIDTVDLDLKQTQILPE